MGLWGGYQFYCSKIEKDDIKTLYAFFLPGIGFCGLVDR